MFNQTTKTDKVLTCTVVIRAFCREGVWLRRPLLAEEGDALPSLNGRARLCVKELGNVRLISCDVDRLLALLDLVLPLDGAGEIVVERPLITWPVDLRSTLIQL